MSLLLCFYRRFFRHLFSFHFGCPVADSYVFSIRHLRLRDLALYNNGNGDFCRLVRGWFWVSFDDKAKKVYKSAANELSRRPSQKTHVSMNGSLNGKRNRRRRKREIRKVNDLDRENRKREKEERKNKNCVSRIFSLFLMFHSYAKNVQAQFFC